MPASIYTILILGQFIYMHYDLSMNNGNFKVRNIIIFYTGLWMSNLYIKMHYMFIIQIVLSTLVLHI